MGRLGIGVLIMLCSVATRGAVYKWVDEKGNTIYSDRPQPGATELAPTGAVQTVESFKARREPPAAPVSRALPYSSVAIIEPAADATFRDDAVDVQVAVSLTPPLQQAFGHKLQLFVDGKPHGKPGPGQSFRLSNVDRGTHQLRAVVIDKDGKEVAAASSAFHMHRTSIEKKASPKPAPVKPPAPKPAR
jgi:hypothetical protein